MESGIFIDRRDLIGAVPMTTALFKALKCLCLRVLILEKLKIQVCTNV